MNEILRGELEEFLKGYAKDYGLSKIEVIDEPAKNEYGFERFIVGWLKDKILFKISFNHECKPITLFNFISAIGNEVRAVRFEWFGKYSE